MTTARSPLRVAVAHLAYGAIVHLACLLAVPPWLVRVWRDRRQLGWTAQRFGHLPPGLPGGRPIWLHAVSVGEVKASRPLVEALRRACPEVPVVLSTGTLTGFDTARRAFPDLYVFALPLDLPWVVSRVVGRIAPRLLVLMELEVWPSLLRIMDGRGIPRALVNARVSESSFRSYRLLRWWLPEFERLSGVAAQDARHAARLQALGVPPDRIRVTGNLKHDVTSAAPPGVVGALREELGLRDGPPVFVAGSTHDGEDQAVVRAWQAAGGPARCRLVLVPRHLDRVREIERLLRRLDVRWMRRSVAPDRRLGPDEILLVDTMGELEACFGLADVVFLGGSLVPVGGHNVLEPAAAGRPVLVGPHLETCRLEAETLARAGGLEVVADEAALGRALGGLLEDAPRRMAMGNAAAAACRGLAGATRATMELLRQLDLLGGGPLHAGGKCDMLSGSASAEQAPLPSRQGASFP